MRAGTLDMNGFLRERRGIPKAKSDRGSNAVISGAHADKGGA
jgi:hypothetical protein